MNLLHLSYLTRYGQQDKDMLEADGTCYSVRHIATKSVNCQKQIRSKKAQLTVNLASVQNKEAAILLYYANNMTIPI